MHSKAITYQTTTALLFQNLKIIFSLYRVMKKIVNKEPGNLCFNSAPVTKQLDNAAKA